MKINNVFNLKSGISPGLLKSIALIAMLIDHIGHYFSIYMNNNIYTILRATGRISMPIFAFLLVQGFIHTRDIRKYISRMFLFAIITQALILIAAFINLIYVPEYSMNIYLKANILLSFTMALLAMLLIKEKKIIKKLNVSQNMIVQAMAFSIIVLIYFVIPIDHGIEAFVLILLIYAAESLKKWALELNQNNNEGLKARTIYIIFLIISFIIIKIYLVSNWYFLLSLPVIILYNENKNKKSKRLQKFYYIFFPAHHFLLYVVAMLMSLT